MVLQRFFTSSLAWLRGYIAPLLYTDMLSSRMVLQWFFGVINVLYSTTAKQRTCQAPLNVLYKPNNHCWCCLAPFFVEEIQFNMAPLMVLHSTIWQRCCIAPLNIWCYIAPKVVPLWLWANNHVYCYIAPSLCIASLEIMHNTNIIFTGDIYTGFISHFKFHLSHSLHWDFILTKYPKKLY